MRLVGLSMAVRVAEIGHVSELGRRICVSVHPVTHDSMHWQLTRYVASRHELKVF